MGLTVDSTATAVLSTAGKPLDVRVAHHFVVRGGLIVRFEQFVDTAEVLAAMRP
ncbi:MULTISPECIES: nuclear transport factor 2 family protein [Kitasatospora]|uniref:SnoaL-like domain-containing protein n=1 Tax=Kitasatospora cystarginea TaxID=58350 RepID=A0ABN3DM48_9ACTN